MLTVDALKEVYKSLGGSADDVKNMTLNADVIAAIATKVAGAGSVLPTVAVGDAGKVLTVNSEGKWAAILPEA